MKYCENVGFWQLGDLMCLILFRVLDLFSIAPPGFVTNDLRQAQVKVIAQSVCSHSSVYGTYLTPQMICAGTLNGGADACQVEDLHVQQVFDGCLCWFCFHYH